ncbi:MAG: septal ring lytic transglycosylase RlpA family protein [Rhizobiaceae bacterium]
MKNYQMKTLSSVFVAASILLAAASSASAKGEQCGDASWYALTSKTANGERMDPSKMTAAHRNLPFDTKVQVTNKSNGRSIVVRINDRGPFIKGRIVDLSKAAAGELGFIRSGVTDVCLHILS